MSTKPTQLAMHNDPTRHMRLLQLLSPNLPIGAFTYSQGLEWAIEEAWIGSQETLQEWLADTLRSSLCHVEIPVFKRLYEAYHDNKPDQAQHWILYLLASRETSELKTEEQQRGRAFARLLPELDCQLEEQKLKQVQQAQLAGFAYIIARWKIDPVLAIQLYTWSWVENMALAGVKLIPLGQTAGQQIVYRLGESVAEAVKIGLSLEDEDIGFSCTAQAIASSLHETQYTRLYRS